MRAGAAVTTLGGSTPNRLIIVGGLQGTKYLLDTWMFDALAMTWSLLTVTPQGGCPPAFLSVLSVVPPTPAAPGSLALWLLGGYDGGGRS